MPAMIHLDGRSYTLPTDPDPQEVATAVRAAIGGDGSLEVQVEIDGGPVTLFVNTNRVGVIALDWNGGGLGFFHG